MSSEITLRLSAAQARRLREIASRLNVTPDQFAVVELFSAIDSHDGDAAGFLECWPGALASYGRGVARRGSSSESLERGLLAAESGKSPAPSKIPDAPTLKSPTNWNTAPGGENHSAPTSTQSAPPADPLFVAMCEFEGLNPARPHPRNQIRIERALQEIKRFKPALTPDEIKQAGLAVRRLYPASEMTSCLLLSHFVRVDLRRHEPERVALVFRPFMGAPGMPAAEFGPGVQMQWPHTHASALYFAAKQRYESSKHGGRGRSLFVTNAESAERIRAEAVRIYWSRFKSLRCAQRLVEAVEIYPLGNWSRKQGVEAARSLAAELKECDHLMIFNDRCDVLPGVSLLDLPSTFVAEVLDGAAAILPPLRVKWSANPQPPSVPTTAGD